MVPKTFTPLKERTVDIMMIACSVNQETLFSDFNRGGGEQQRTSRRRGGSDEGERQGIEVEVDLCREVDVIGGEGVGSLVSLGLTRKVRLSEGISVFVINKSNPSPHPVVIQIWPKRIRLYVGPPACAATAQATWHNNGQRKGRSSDKMNRSETREVR